MVYRFSTDKSEFDLPLIHQFLSTSYWSPEIPFETVKRAVENSLCFALFEEGKSNPTQVAFGRFITDETTFAYLADVFVVESHQGKGLGKKLMERAFALPELQGLRRLMLATSTAHGLYEKYGFTPLKDPSMMMEKTDLDIYRKDK